MPTISDALAAYLTAQRTKRNCDLVDLWSSRGPAWETQIGDNDSRFKCRIQPGWNDSDFAGSLDGLPIGFSGWCHAEFRSYFIGIDIDATKGHEKSKNTLTPDEIDEVYENLSGLDYLEIRKSTSGQALHVYVRVDGIPSDSRAVHKKLGEAIIDKISTDAGFDFKAKKDKVGGMLWFVSAKANETNRGLELLKPATRVLSESDLPADWRDTKKPAPVTPTTATSTADIDGALAAMRKIKMPDNKDGTGRLHAYCCRCRAHGLNLHQTIAAVRLIAADKPSPIDWTDAKIEECWTAALLKVEVGSASNSEPDLWGAEGRTDAANARRFVLKFGDRIRWVDPWGKWVIWNGRFWEQDNTCQIDALAKRYARSLWVDIGQIIASGQSDDTLRKSLNTFGKSSNSAAGIANMLRLARSEPGVSIKPDQFDTGLFQLNTESGTIDLRTGELYPHCREDLITRMIPTAYDPQAQCPQFLKFLDGVFGGNTNLIGFVQRFSGHCLSGDVSEHVLIICFGEGSNGKSVYLHTMLGLFGEYGTTAPEGLLTAKKFESHPCEVAKLFGKRLIVASETSQDARLSEARVKMLTGGDRLAARGCGENWWDFEQTHKVVLATNHKPVVRGSDHGIWRRLKLTPFLRRFWDKDKGESGPPELEADKSLNEKLKAEYPGILTWLVSGCLAWQRDGLGVPAEVNEATEEYRRSEDLLAAFIANCCVERPEAVANASTILDAYREYSGDTDMTERKITRLLMDKKFPKKRATRGPDKGIWQWRGLGLAECQVSTSDEDLVSAL